MIRTLFLALFICFLSACHQGEHKQNSNSKVSAFANMSNIDFDARLDSLGIKLTKPSPPVANYVNITQAGNILFLAGKGPKDSSGEYIRGKLGQDLTVKEGYEAAHRTAIAQLSVLKDHLGDLLSLIHI